MTPSQIVELKFYARRVLRERDQFGKCGSKMAYGTKMQAERSIRRDAKKAGVVAYRCALCKMFHVGARGIR